MIKTIKIHNFGKIEDLEIDCSNNKNVFILGQNGSGKTTILQAISLALTGKLAKGLTNDTYIGSKDKDFLIVLELDDGTKIGRTCKGAKLKLPNGSVFKKVKDVYEHLSFDPALLYNLSYVRQGEIADLFLSGNGKGVIDKLISLIIDSRRISDGNTELTRMNKQIDDEIDTINRDIQHNQDLMSSINYTGLEQDYKKYTFEYNKLVQLNRYSDSELTLFSSKLDRFETVTTLVKSYKQKYDDFKKNLDSVTRPNITMAELRAKQNLVHTYQDDMVKCQLINDEIVLYNNSKDYADIIDKYISIKLPKTRHSKEELDHIKNVKDSVFHLLTSEDKLDNTEAISLMKEYHKQDDIDADTILATKKQIAEYITILKPYETVVRYIRSIDSSNSLEAIENRVIEFQTQVSDIMSKYTEIPESEVTDIEFNKLQQEWTRYDTAVNMFESAKTDLAKAYSEYKLLEKEVSSYPNREEIVKLRDYSNNISHLKSMIDLCNNHFKLYNEAKSKIDELVSKRDSLIAQQLSIEHWKAIFTDIPNRLRQVLFNPVVAVLNKEFYDLFSFSGLGEIKIDWSKVLITVGNKKFEQLSGAQMVAVGLSLRLALLKIMGECVPIMLVDEPTTFLDDDRKNDIAKLISHMGNVSQCFVSTHDDNIIGGNSVIINLNK